MEIQANKRTQVNVLFGDKTYPLLKLSLGELVDMEKELKEARDAGDVMYNRFQLEFLEKRGLPGPVAREIDADVIGDIVEALMPKKKA